jgi:hypothetical protein
MTDHRNDEKVLFFTCMFLQDVPRIFRGFVSSGIKKGIPESLHPVTIRIYQDQNSWEQQLGVTNSDVPYLILIDSNARIEWLNHGILTTDLYKELQSAINKLIH